MGRRRALTAIALAALWGGCDGSPSGPSRGATVTFSVADERFRVRLTSVEQIEAARAVQAGGTALIPNGRIVSGTEVNTGWNWHLEDVSFAEAAIELCDGRPSDVERRGISFGGGRYCPWAARIVDIDTQ